MSTPSSRATRLMARPMGCSDRLSIDAAILRTSVRAHGAMAWTSTTAGVPCVSVPVLSNAMHRTRPSISRCRPPLMRTPFFAAPASAETMDTGVESTSAHGHEITRNTSAR